MKINHYFYLGRVTLTPKKVLLVFLCFVIFFLPSFEIGQEIQKSIHFFTQKKITLGDTLVFPKNPSVANIFGHKNTFIEMGKVYLFPIGLNSDQVVTISGTFKGEKTFFASSPKTYYFVKQLEVIRPRKTSVKLRLPSSVWKKVNNRHSTKKAREKARVRSLLKSNSSSLQSDCWVSPLTSKIVSQFSSPRTLPNGISYYHTGVDLRAKTGTAIVAPGPGKIAMSEHMTLPGNTIMIDHGSGLFSRYMHLSKFQVQPGDIVKAGQLIGYTGATGRAEGPHLHWEVVWKGSPVNPFGFLRAWEQICDPA